MSESSAIDVRTAEEIETGTGLDSDPKIDQNEKAIDEMVTLAEATLSPASMLAKYAKLGRAFVTHAKWQKKTFKVWTKDSYSQLASRVEDAVKMRLPIKAIRMDVYAKVHVFVECATPIAPGLDKISYYQVSNKFLKMLQWSPVDLEGSIKAEWIGFLTETVARQSSADPMPMKDLDAAIESRETEIKAEKLAKLSPEKALEAEQKAANAKIVAARQASVKLVSTAIGKAIDDKHIDLEDISATIVATAKDRKVTIPGTTVRVQTGLDYKTCNTDDCAAFLVALLQTGKIAELTIIAEHSTQMVTNSVAKLRKMSA